MPSFGLPSSMPPVSSSLSPCLPTLLSSNISSCTESSCAPVLPDGSFSHLFESPYMPPPPPLSFSDASPYSPPPSYPPGFPFGPLLSSGRFPPPPNSSFLQPPGPNITFLEGPHSHYPPEPRTAYDRWWDRNIVSTPYGGDNNISRRFSHWPLPTFNSSISSNNNSNSNNSNFGILKPEPHIFPSPALYPPLDSVTNFGPKFSHLPWDSSAFPNAAVMPSNSAATITPPLASSHFPTFPPPSVPLDFPHSSGRFPFNPHVSTFIPGMDPPPPFGASNAQFIPESFPSYLSRIGASLPSNSFQAPDHFQHASSRPIYFPETAPCPITSNSPSSIFDHSQQPFHGSSTPNPLLSLPLPPHTNDSPGPFCSSEGASVLDPSRDFPPPSALPYPPPLPGTLFCPYSPAPYQEWVRNGGVPFSARRDEERSERIMSDTGKLMYQHLSQEEWRWKHYEHMYADALDPSASFARVRPSGYNHFHGVDGTTHNSSGGSKVKEEGSLLGAQMSQKEQVDNLERCKAEHHHPLKLAASALAEMLALGSSGETSSTTRSMLAHVASTSGTALTSDASFPPANDVGGGQARPERTLDDCCSSSGSAVVHKDVRERSLSHKGGEIIFGETKFGEHTSESSGLNLCSPTRSKRDIPGQLEDAFCDFGGAPAAWAHPRASGQSQSTRRMSWVGGVPQSAKGGALHTTGGQRRVFSKGSAGIMKQPSVSTGFAKIHGVNAESSTSENFNNLFTQSSNLSSRPQSSSMRNDSSQPVGVLSSEDPTSVIGPFTSKITVASGLSVFGPGQEVSSSGVNSQLPLDSSHDDQWHAKSTSCGSSPPLSQAYLDPHGSISGRTTGAGSRVLANLNWACPNGSIQTEIGYLGTGIHSLTASISNLSKVLFSLDSSALTPSDSAVLEESLQSSILRLSECLILEQSRINRNPATRCVGSDESSASRQGRADGSFTDVDLVHRVEAGGNTNLSHLKASEASTLTGGSRTGSPVQLHDSNGHATAADIAVLETFKTSGSVAHSHNFQRPVPLKSDSCWKSKCSTIDGEISAGKDSGCSYNKASKDVPSAQQYGAVTDDVIEFLRHNKIFEVSSLERLIGAEAREAKLKILIDELREELELERVENRGTAILCEKIVQEAEVSKGNALMQDAGQTHSEFKRGKVECNRQHPGSSVNDSITESSCKTRSLGFNVQANFGSDDKDNCIELEEELGSAAHANGSEEPLLDNIHQVEALPAFLRSRVAVVQAQPETTAHLNSSYDTSGSELEEDSDAVAYKNSSVDAVACCANSSEDAVPDNMDQVLSRLALLQARPEALAHQKISHDLSVLHDISENLESQLELLQAHSAATLSTNISHDMFGSVVSQLALLREQSEVVESQLELLGAKATANLHVKISPNMSESVESRLALLQSRPALLQSRPEATAHLNISHDTSGDLESLSEPMTHPEYSPDVSTDANVVDAEATQENAIHDTAKDFNRVKSQHAVRQSVSPLDALQDTDHVEARLALLQARPGWDNELGVFTETEPCSPAKPAAENFNFGRGGPSGSSLLGLGEERAALTGKVLEAMSHVTSQLLIQCKTISNIYAAWSQLSKQVNSKHLDKEFNTELQLKGAGTEVLSTSAKTYDDSEAVEAQALLVRSRTGWTEGDGSESESDGFLGGKTCKISSASSGCGRYDSNQFETLNEISLVRLLDCDGKMLPLHPMKNTSDNPSLEGANGNTCTVESPHSGKGTAKSQDSDEDSGWEHIRLPPQKETE